MFHSTWISEPLAQFFGLVMGILGYALSGYATPDHSVRLLIGGTASVLTNLLIGAKINIVTLDMLALVVARPLSAYAGWKVLQWVAGFAA